MGNNYRGGGGNNTRNGVDVDYTPPGAIVPMNSLASMLNNAMQSHQMPQQTGIQMYETKPMTVEQAYAQPVQVQYVNRTVVPKPLVPDIQIPYTEVWKASRLHPQNSWRYLWYPYSTLR